MSSNLIKRLETAPEGSRELDAEIAASRDHLGRRPHPHAAPGWIVGGDADQPLQAPAYTTSLDAALTLLPPDNGGRFAIDPNEDREGDYTGRWDAYVSGGIWVTAATPALAVCLSALHASNLDSST